MRKQYGPRRMIGFAAFFAFLWWAFTDSSTYQLWIGLGLIVLATAVSLKNPVGEKQPRGVRAVAIAKFIPYFIYQSLKGGVLVAKLAFLPHRRVRSEYYYHEVQIPADETMARMCFAACLCIFPGTLSCGYNGDVLTIHVLDSDMLDKKAVLDLEQMAFAIFAVQRSYNSF